MSDIQIRALEHGDEAAVLEAYRDACGHARDAAAWRWAFTDHPVGRRVMLAVRAGTVLAQYAALPCVVWIDGEAHVFGQVVDTLVRRSLRAGLGGSRLLLRTAEAFFAAHGGPDAVFYGWPVGHHQRLGERRLGYETTRSQLALVRGLERARLPRSPGGVTPLARFDEQVQWLYERCASGFGASTVRDERWMNWRYVERPDVDYLRLGVRDADGTLRGLLVGRVLEHGERTVGLVADWLVPPAEPAVGEALLAAFGDHAASAGAEALALWIPEWSPWFARLQDAGFRVVPTDWDLVTRSFRRALDPSFLRESWWLQPGDSDLV
ncbi:MAG: hypothetical protein V3T22_13310 [Planctomycetota bacterium]